MKKVFDYFVLCVVFFAPFCLIGGLRFYNEIIFSIHCEGHLKRAADANTIEIAKKELQTAIDYLEKNKITDGFTSVIYQSPNDDIGFFYNNLKSSIEELDKVTTDTTQLERTNVLMKLRETLLDHKDSGDKVTLPDAIQVFPNNKTYFWGGIGLLIWAIIGFVAILVKLQDY